MPDSFDFLDSSIPKRSDSNENKPQETLTQEGEIRTSYLLVNALFNLLLQKNIIQESEVKAILKELKEEYLNKGGK